jgi:hypothetical protein
MELPHERVEQFHPGSTFEQFALHPSPLMVLPSSHASMPERTLSPQVVLQRLGCAALQLYPHSTEQMALQPSLPSLLPSSHPSPEVLIPSPQTPVQMDLTHERAEQVHPGSTIVQSALHPSPLLVLPSSHVSLPASLKSPQVVLQTLGSAAVQVYPHSTEHLSLQPSLPSLLPSSHSSPLVLLLFPQIPAGSHCAVVGMVDSAIELPGVVVIALRIIPVWQIFLQGDSILFARMHMFGTVWFTAHVGFKIVNRNE